MRVTRSSPSNAAWPYLEGHQTRTAVDPKMHSDAHAGEGRVRES